MSVNTFSIHNYYIITKKLYNYCITLWRHQHKPIFPTPHLPALSLAISCPRHSSFSESIARHLHCDDKQDIDIIMNEHQR